MKKRLQLHRETLRNLETDLISKAVGGISVVTGCTTVGTCSNCDGTLCPRGSCLC
jgi:hypothetical protein